jgi:two-component system, chemotaxis family, sensor kinase CheA
MEQFIQEFKVEAFGIIQKLQENLLSLEQEKNNKSLIEEIFRGIHTLKGSARMFGFDKIEHVTHNLENTYDLIRSGEVKTSAGIIELSLEVVDVCSDILNDNVDKKRYKDLLGKLGSQEILNAPTQESNLGVFQVFYHPLENVYERGVNPVAALQELETIGECKVLILKGDKTIEEQSIEKKFSTVFEVLINLKVEKTQLEDVFLFMDPREFAIHELSADHQTWQYAINRAQELAGQKFDEETIASRMQILNDFFENAALTVAEVREEKAELEPTQATRVKTSDSSAALHYINVKLSRLDDMMRLVSELVTIKAELHYRSTVLNDIALSNSIDRLEKVTNRFRDNAFSMRLVPLQIMSMKFQRMVRDLGEKLGKDVNLLTEGLETEIDKTIIHEIEAPIMHIIRNALDHGLETTEERKRIGKDAKGLLKIVAFYAGANVFIQIQDDGRGLNLARIREKAVAKGLISASSTLTDKEIINLIFEPGFSTHDEATEYSGRGVGMDVVKQKLKELRGSVEITTEPGLGTAFTLRLPLSLSILDVLHVKVGGINYLLPHSEVEQCLSERLNTDIVQRRGFNIKYKGNLLPHLHLKEIFNLQNHFDQEPCIIVLNKNDQLIAVEVDEIVGEEQLVVKPVDEALRTLDYLSGISVLGNGELAFLLDSIKLRESFAIDNARNSTTSAHAKG